MADLTNSKLLEQLERQQGLAAVYPSAQVDADAEPPAPARRTRQRAAASKRSTWKACTFYLPPETKARLERVLLQRKLAGSGGAADQSEAINEALQAWLAKAEKPFT
jgi:hypothetical protein